MNKLNKAVKAAKMLADRQHARHPEIAWVRYCLIGFLREVTGKNLRDFRWIVFFPFKEEK